MHIHAWSMHENPSVGRVEPRRGIEIQLLLGPSERPGRSMEILGEGDWLEFFCDPCDPEISRNWMV